MGIFLHVSSYPLWCLGPLPGTLRLKLMKEIFQNWRDRSDRLNIYALHVGVQVWFLAPQSLPEITKYGPKATTTTKNLSTRLILLRFFWRNSGFLGSQLHSLNSSQRVTKLNGLETGSHMSKKEEENEILRVSILAELWTLILRSYSLSIYTPTVLSLQTYLSLLLISQC